MLLRLRISIPAPAVEKNPKKWKIFATEKRGVNSPRLPRNSPQSPHQKTTVCTPFFSKTPAKTRFYLG
jgi:hypothetical protein